MDDRLPAEKKFSWWELRSTIEKRLFFGISICAIVILYLASNLLMIIPATKETLQRDVCMTQQCIRSAAIILEKIDETVDPCEDFYKFACGKFLKNTIIPNDKDVVFSYSSLSHKIQLQLMDLFEEPLRDSHPQFFKLVKTVYSSCMNTTKNEHQGFSYLKRVFNELGGWPVVEPHWNEKDFDWKNLLFRSHNDSMRLIYFFHMYVGPDMKNSSRNILGLTQPNGLGDRVNKSLNDTSVKSEYDSMVKLAVFFGADRRNATADMKDVINFEIDLANLMMTDRDRTNISLDYNPIRISELERNFTRLPWLKLINNYLSPIDMLTSDDVVNVPFPEFFEKLEDFLPKVKNRTLANYMIAKLVLGVTNYLPEAFKTKELQDMDIVYSKDEAILRWKRCLWNTATLNIAVSSLYIKKFFDKSTKLKVNELTTDIKSAFLDTLIKVSWMDRKTKKHALLKAEAINSSIGYPEEILDDKKVEEYYQGLELDSDGDYLKIGLNLSEFFHKKDIQRLRQPVTKADWRSKAFSYDVNAFYVPSENTIELRAGILQDYFYDPDRPQYMNYGIIGEVIGHEITHGFDNRGRQYDKDGNLVDWWEPETNRVFTRKSQCLVEQYGNYTVPEIEINLNGAKSLGENIADNGGVKIAYKGYLKWLDRNKPEPVLPGLPYTARQLFWISSATNWCTKHKKEYLKVRVKIGRHVPSYFRVMVPFMNSDYFGNDFNCPLGSPMNPKYKCRVW